MLLQDKEKNDCYRWLFGFLPVLFLGISLILTTSYFASTYYLMSPRLLMNEWSCSGKIGDQHSWDNALSDLQVAKKLDPWNADIYMDIGRLYEWKALSGAAWNTESKNARSKASEHFKQAAIHRPTWALAWVNYAQSQLLNRVIDDEVYHAISNGFEFGRRQMKTQQKLLWLSIGIWEKLPPEIKRQVREQVRYTLGRYDGIEMLISIAIRFQWFDELTSLANPEELAYIESVRRQPKKMRDMLRGNDKQQNFVCRVSA